MDVLTKEQRHKNMSHIKNKDTKIEVTLRKALWHKGYRYLKNVAALPGKPDIVLRGPKIAIFCDSEFFHGKDWDNRRPRLEKSVHSDFWIKKIGRNIERDQEVNKQLTTMGWTVLRFWGNDILKNTSDCVRIIDECVFNLAIDKP